MERLVSYALLLTITITACNSAKNAAVMSPSGDWELVIFPSEGKEFAELFGQRKPRLQFDELNKKVTGTSGCNHISGAYTQNGKEFRFAENMIMTKMACPGYDENIFMEALRKVNRYQIENDQLSLMQNDTMLMTFAKKKST